MSTARGPRLPTTRGDWRLMGRTVRLVLTVPVYAAVAAVAAAVSLTLFVVSLNVPLVLDLVVGGSLPVASRLRVLGELYPFIGTSFNPPQGLLLLVVAALTGVDIGLATTTSANTASISSRVARASPASSSGRSARAVRPAGRRSCWACCRCWASRPRFCFCPSTGWSSHCLRS